MWQFKTTPVLPHSSERQESGCSSAWLGLSPVFTRLNSWCWHGCFLLGVLGMNSFPGPLRLLTELGFLCFWANVSAGCQLEVGVWSQRLTASLLMPQGALSDHGLSFPVAWTHSDFPFHCLSASIWRQFPAVNQLDWAHLANLATHFIWKPAE